MENVKFSHIWLFSDGTRFAKQQRIDFRLSAPFA